MNEMKRFRNLLDAMEIEWEDNSEPGIIRTKGHDWSVIFGEFTYGASTGLLEVWNYETMEEPEGHCNALESLLLVTGLATVKKR